jgi:hypothetical protein
MGPRLLPRPIAPDQIILCAYEPLPSKAAQTCSKTSSIMLFSLFVSAHDPPPRSNDPLMLDKRPFLLTGPLLLQRGPNKMPESTATAAKESYNNVIQMCAWDISYLYLQVQGRIGSERVAEVFNLDCSSSCSNFYHHRPRGLAKGSFCITHRPGNNQAPEYINNVTGMAHLPSPVRFWPCV